MSHGREYNIRPFREDIGHTDTFLSVGCFETENEAQCLLKYLKTKFARALLSTLKVTQDNFAEKWANVPIQEFGKPADIDWFGSIAEIDRQLYSKYALSDEEIDFIESSVEPMQ